jgi:hypothetical protein
MENEHSDAEEQFKRSWLEEGKQLHDLLNEIMDRWMEEQSPA